MFAPTAICVNFLALWCISVDLLGLLNWRSNPQDLEQILQRLMEVEGGEIVKVRTASLTGLTQGSLSHSFQDVQWNYIRSLDINNVFHKNKNVAISIGCVSLLHKMSFIDYKRISLSNTCLKALLIGTAFLFYNTMYDGFKVIHENKQILRQRDLSLHAFEGGGTECSRWWLVGWLKKRLRISMVCWITLWGHNIAFFSCEWVWSTI